ncbi:hypothetical protein M2271_003579 [Streptomyces sp. LBL]|uniref:hypothetical protein n=1 Tax=Streptomyces sp. LBL TaxID=2940562 RepID=UPI0024733F20|nr:hypothetical protein [Streptomyces sp. LBL]MDH6625768.1 hypothetical protein [Streptomyces sp. LBL]
MAKVIGSSGLTVELTGQEVELVRQALLYSERNNTAWDSPEDRIARELEQTLARGVE